MDLFCQTNIMAAFEIAYSELTPLVEPEGNVSGGLNKPQKYQTKVFTYFREINMQTIYLVISA